MIDIDILDTIVEWSLKQRTQDELNTVAHKQTLKECKELGIKVYQREDNGDITYTKEAQAIFNKYYKLK